MALAIYAKIRYKAYLNVDWDFRPQGYSPSSCNSFATSKYTDRSHGKVDIRPQPRTSAATSSNSPDGSKGLSHRNIVASPASSSNYLDRSEGLSVSAGPSGSAIDKLNEIILHCGSKKIHPDDDATVNVVERFQLDRTICLGNTLKGKRCRRRNCSEDRQEIEKLLTELAKMNLDNNRKRCRVRLLKLTDMAVCTYQRKKVQEKVRLIVPPRPLKDSAGRSASSIIKEDAINIKLEELPAQIIIRDKRRTTRGQKVQSVDTSIVIPGKITKAWEPPKPASSYFLKYRPFYTEAFRNSDVTQWVIQKAEKPLTPRQCKSGHLYVYWNKTTFGDYKIGFTTIDVDTRLKRWESQCKHPAQKMYESPFTVRNAERVERLVHAELKKYRVKEWGCHGCGGNHDEWFRGVDHKVIIGSIEFWTEWMMKEDGPYEEVESTWRLKEDAARELPELCSRLSVVKGKESKAKRPHKRRPRTARRVSSTYRRGFV